MKMKSCVVLLSTLSLAIFLVLLLRHGDENRRDLAPATHDAPAEQVEAGSSFARQESRDPLEPGILFRHQGEPVAPRCVSFMDEEGRWSCPRSVDARYVVDRSGLIVACDDEYRPVVQFIQDPRELVTIELHLPGTLNIVDRTGSQYELVCTPELSIGARSALESSIGDLLMVARMGNRLEEDTDYGKIASSLSRRSENLALFENTRFVDGNFVDVPRDVPCSLRVHSRRAVRATPDIVFFSRESPTAHKSSSIVLNGESTTLTLEHCGDTSGTGIRGVLAIQGGEPRYSYHMTRRVRTKATTSNEGFKNGTVPNGPFEILDLEPGEMHFQIRHETASEVVFISRFFALSEGEIKDLGVISPEGSATLRVIASKLGKQRVSVGVTSKGTEEYCWANGVISLGLHMSCNSPLTLRGLPAGEYEYRAGPMHLENVLVPMTRGRFHFPAYQDIEIELETIETFDLSLEYSLDDSRAFPCGAWLFDRSTGKSIACARQVKTGGRWKGTWRAPIGVYEGLLLGRDSGHGLYGECTVQILGDDVVQQVQMRRGGIVTGLSPAAEATHIMALCRGCDIGTFPLGDGGRFTLEGLPVGKQVRLRLTSEPAFAEILGMDYLVEEGSREIATEEWR